jgi:hypothetical protein
VDFVTVIWITSKPRVMPMIDSLPVVDGTIIREFMGGRMTVGTWEEDEVWRASVEVEEEYVA